MLIVSLEQAEEGQVLAAAVRNAAGAVLVPTGATLTAALLARLKAIGTTRVVVGPTDLEPSPEWELARLDERFAGHEGDTLMMSLKAAVRTHISRSTDAS